MDENDEWIDMLLLRSILVKDAIDVAEIGPRVPPETLEAREGRLVADGYVEYLVQRRRGGGAPASSHKRLLITGKGLLRLRDLARKYGATSSERDDPQ